MKEVTGNLWDYPAQFRVITTNGAVRRDGACVMGRGCAAEAKQRYPDLPYYLGSMIRLYGNHVWCCRDGVITFPVKHHWTERADPALIAVSVEALRTLALATPDSVFVMPRPGCGNGGLKWEDVRPLLLSLPDNVHVITFAQEGEDK